MPAQTGTKVVKSVKIHHTDCVCEGYQPPWGGVGPDAALLLVPVDPGEGAVGAHVCQLCPFGRDHDDPFHVILS